MEEIVVEATIINDTNKHPVELASRVIDIEHIEINNVQNNVQNNKIQNNVQNNNNCYLILLIITSIGYICSLVYLKLFINEKYNFKLTTMLKTEIGILIFLCCIGLFTKDNYNDNDQFIFILCSFCYILLYVSAVYYILISIIVDSILLIS